MKNYNNYDIVEEIFDNMEEHPKKYMRVQIKGDKGVIALTGCDGMVLRKALVAEFQNGQLSQLYEFDSEKTIRTICSLSQKRIRLLPMLLGTEMFPIVGIFPAIKARRRTKRISQHPARTSFVAVSLLQSIMRIC